MIDFDEYADKYDELSSEMEDENPEASAVFYQIHNFFFDVSHCDDPSQVKASKYWIFEAYDTVNNPAKAFEDVAGYNLKTWPEYKNFIKAIKSGDVISYMRQFVKKEDLKVFDEAIRVANDNPCIEAAREQQRIEDEEAAKKKKQRATALRALKAMIGKENIFAIETCESTKSWVVILNTEDEYEAQDIKYDVAESLGISGDEDIPTIRKENTMLRLTTFADWSEDEYEDLSEDVRVEACQPLKMVDIPAHSRL